MTGDTDFRNVGTEVFRDQVRHTEKPYERAKVRHEKGERFRAQMDLGADEVGEMVGFDRRACGDGMGIEEVQKSGEMAPPYAPRPRAASPMLFVLELVGHELDRTWCWDARFRMIRRPIR